jgi:hypothetical protein
MVKQAGVTMPMISPRADLRNNCNASDDDIGKMELYSLIEEGLDDVRQGRIKPADEVLVSLRQKMGY